MITIIDYDMGNVGSIKNMLEHIGCEDVEISNDKQRILSSDHIILPGVGSFDEGMKNLQERGLVEIITEYANILKKPLLGICLGMQLLGNSSEEGNKKGLGLIDFENIRFRLNNGLKVPHMGWNSIHVVDNDCPFTKDLDDSYRFYYVHSYHAKVNNLNSIILTADYGYEIPVGLRNGNTYGVQFHPEKSHQFGMKLLENFVRLENA